MLLRTIIGLIPKRHGKIEVLGVDLDIATEHPGKDFTTNLNNPV